MDNRHERRRPRVLLILRRLLASGPFVIFSVVAAIACAIGALLVMIQTPYQIQMPGPVTEVQTLIEPNPNPGTGGLYLTTIYSDPANVAEWLYAKIDPAAGLVPREEARPREISDREYDRLLGRMMDESKITAQVVALRAAGYDVQVRGQGVRVHEIVEESKAKGILQSGDIIVELDGKPVSTANDLIALVQGHLPGDVVDVVAIRDDQRVPVRFALIEAPNEPGRARAGVAISTYQYDYELPREFDLKTRNIGGPSAGLMFSLGIYNAVTPEDVTKGHKIAGTGTMSSEGRVGAVGGVKYKIVAAERAGATVFLVPEANAEEARKAASTIRVIPVRTFDEALQALNELPPKA
ncbi:MAG TPA: S16 family serine protease [Chloroflexota bacterium]|nr:S16 family serine protease [Chloroflexota bacterium]